MKPSRTDRHSKPNGNSDPSPTPSCQTPPHSFERVDSSPWISDSDLAPRAQHLLALALRSSTAAVAVFDESFRCTAVNSALFSVSRIPPQACLGKTLPQLLGGRPEQVHRAFKFVRDTGATLRHVPLSPLAPNHAAARHWIADFFPLRDPSRGIHWIGTTLCEAPRKTHLRQKLYHVSGRNLSNDHAAEFHSAPTEEIAETCEPVLRRSLDLLDRSMALRRQISEMRLAASLHRRSRPVIWVKPIGPYLQVASVSLDPSEQNPATNESSTDEELSTDLLSARELQVVRLLAEGNSNKQIAVTLDLSTRTIETYRARLMIKLDLHSLGELIRYAVRHLLIQA
ncbi:MAG: LuxR C-terminal-related transcriptional regulator [Candidatus Acidiferrum sp.]